MADSRTKEGGRVGGKGGEGVSTSLKGHEKRSDDEGGQ